jgi:hypothetical protein
MVARGQELTRNQPPDHHHHFGLWNAWTQVAYQGATYDLWNLALKQGTVRFVRLLSAIEGPVYAEYKALLEHVIFQKNGKEQVVLNEVQTVRIYPPANGQNNYTLDLSMEMNCATENPFSYFATGMEDWVCVPQENGTATIPLSLLQRERTARMRIPLLPGGVWYRVLWVQTKEGL